MNSIRFALLALCICALSSGKVNQGLSSSGKMIRRLRVSHLPCYEDELCKFYDDCCQHYYNAQRFHSCKELKHLSAILKFVSFAFVVDRCPTDTNDALKQKCERSVHASEGLERKIVIASKDNRLFRNVFCVLCHGADFEEPTVKMRCKSNTTENSTVTMDFVNDKRSGCFVHTLLPSKTYRNCQETRNVVSRCPTRKWKRTKMTTPFSSPFNGTYLLQLQENCAKEPTYYSQCRDDNRTFRNLYCAKCNTLPNSCYAPKKGRTPFESIAYPDYSDYPYRYSVLTDFRSFAKNLRRKFFSKANNNSSFDNSTERFDDDRNSAISNLTLTFCTLSALGLVIFLGVFIIVPQLRSFGGVITMSLASSLLVGLICFLIGPHIKSFSAACRALAVVMYYAYLSSFAWMSLFAVDVLKTFLILSPASRSRTGNNLRQSIRRYGKFAVAGWFLPLIVTMSAVTVDEVMPNSTACPRFGLGQCYFNSEFGLLSWFYVPVAVAVLANVVMSAVAIGIIWRTTQQTRRVRGNGWRKQLILLSLRITAIFGITWVLGLSSALGNNELFKEIAGLINSLQGVFISLSFLLSQRTIQSLSSISSRS